PSPPCCLPPRATVTPSSAHCWAQPWCSSPSRLAWFCCRFGIPQQSIFHTSAEHLASCSSWRLSPASSHLYSACCATKPTSRALQCRLTTKLSTLTVLTP